MLDARYCQYLMLRFHEQSIAAHICPSNFFFPSIVTEIGRDYLPLSSLVRLPPLQSHHLISVLFQNLILLQAIRRQL